MHYSDMHYSELITHKCVRNEAFAMYNDLFNCQLIVCLSGPIDDTGRRLRVVECQNPKWYRDLFNRYYNGKKGKRSRAKIKRYLVVNALSNLIKGCYKDSFTYNVLMHEIESRVTEGYYIEEFCVHVPPQL